MGVQTDKWRDTKRLIFATFRCNAPKIRGSRICSAGRPSNVRNTESMSSCWPIFASRRIPIYEQLRTHCIVKEYNRLPWWLTPPTFWSILMIHNTYLRKQHRFIFLPIWIAFYGGDKRSFITGYNFTTVSSVPAHSRTDKGVVERYA